MNKILVALALSLCSTSAFAMVKVEPKSPAVGVVCDIYICADSKGISIELTQKFLGKTASEHLSKQGDFDRSEFTFANGVFCDSKERLCRKDRYFGLDGKRSGVVDEHYTELLFGQIP